MSFYVYVYRDPRRSDEPFYVGKGSKDRALTHLKRSHNRELNFKLSRMKGLGVVPKVEIIDAIDENHAFLMEKCLIEAIGRKDLKKGPLLNRTDGGEGPTGRVCPDHIREQKRARWTGEGNPSKNMKPSHRDAIRQARTGARASITARINMSRSQVGKRAGEKHPMFGKKTPEHVLSKLSASASGKKWWNNGVQSKLSYDRPGNEWVPGRTTFTRRTAP